MDIRYLSLGLAIGLVAGIAADELVICISSGLVLGYAIGEARKKKALRGDGPRKSPGRGT